jgi:putative ABC transport system permease protein
MTRLQLILRNLLFHWQGNSAVFLGVVVSTAVLTGALLVGDALRGSLRQLTLDRLGWIDKALVGPRFIRETVADKLDAKQVSPALVVRATVSVGENGPPIRQVQLIGVDDRFWDGKPPLGPAFWKSDVKEVVLNRALAARVAPAAMLWFRVQTTSEVPREFLLGRKDSDHVVSSFQCQVREVLAHGDFGDRFSAQPTVEAPRNAFVPLHTLQELLDQPGRVNALFVKGGGDDLAKQFQANLTLDDWGLRLQTPRSRAAALLARFGGKKELTKKEWDRLILQKSIPTSMAAAIKPASPDIVTAADIEDYYRQRHGYLSLESRQLLLEPLFAKAALEAAEECNLRTAPTLVYLANSIRNVANPNPDEAIAYSVVAALDPTQPPPLGPFLPPGVKALRDDQIVLVDWPDSPLPFVPGMDVRLTYYPPDQHGDNQEVTSPVFHAVGAAPLPLTGAAADPDLTPEFPGLTDKTTIGNWDPPFTIDRKRVKPRDEAFWAAYRTTPKAYVTLAAGQKLWGSRFGNLTSIRMAPQQDVDLEKAAAAFENALLGRLKPELGGLIFDDVRKEGLEASMGGTDFAGLFAGFSFFLIAAALLLVGLLFRLNLDRRAGEIGLLIATGYRRAAVTRILLGEGLLLAVIGAAVGCGVALGYAALLVQLLAALWPGGALQSFLRPHFENSGLSLLIGYGGSVLASAVTIAWTLRGLARVPPRTLLSGQTAIESAPGPIAKPRWSWWVALIALVAALLTALLTLSGRVQDHEMKAFSFFSSGALLLTAALAALSGWMRSGRQLTVEGPGLGSIARLGVRNAARNPLRSMLTAGLLATAAFLIVAVESFRRHAGNQDDSVTGPSGGFSLFGEADVPQFQGFLIDPQNKASQRAIVEKLTIAFGEELKGNQAAGKKKAEAALELLQQVKIVPLRAQAGDDVSCLNLYQARRPRLLGVPESLITRPGGFQFAVTAANASDSERGNPWLLLDRPGDDVPVFGEQNTVTWMLKKSLDGELPITDGNGMERKLRIVGLLQDSVFQNSLLVSEKRFLELYPKNEGFTVFLLDAPKGEVASVKKLLETAYADQGLALTPTAERLESFLAVENTYLSTFQALGGLGLLLGSLGLAVVLLRSVWERRAELALLRALGYRRTTLGWMVLAENGFLLLVGLASGTAAALLSVLPQMVMEGGSIPWLNLAALLGLVPVVGLTAAVLAVAATLRAPLIPALRRE